MTRAGDNLVLHTRTRARLRLGRGGQESDDGKKIKCGLASRRAARGRPRMMWHSPVSPGKAAPEVPGAPERTLPAVGRGGGQQLERNSLASGVIPYSSFRDGRWRGTPRLPRDTRPPSPRVGTLSRSPAVGVAGGGRGSGGEVPAPARLLRREKGTGRRASLQKCQPGAGSGGPGHCCPRWQPGTPRRFAQSHFPGEPPATPGHGAEVPKTKDPTPKPLLAKSQRAESISPGSFPPPPAELRAGPSRGSGAAAACGRGSEQGRAAGLLCGGHPPGEVRGEWSRDLKELPRKGATQTCGRPPNPICRAVGAKRRCQGLFISRRNGGSGPRIARR